MKRILVLTAMTAVAILVCGCCKCRYARKQAQRPLAGTEWKLVQMNGQKIDQSEPDSFVLLFMDEGRLGGRSACNSLIANYKVTEERALKIERVGSTMMMCYDNREEVFNAMLDRVTHYDLDGQTLMLLSNGEIVALFTERPVSIQ